MTRPRPTTPARRLALEPLDRRDLPDGSGTAIPWGVKAIKTDIEKLIK